MAYVTDYTALLTGASWSGIEVLNTPNFVTYSFDTTAPASDASVLAPSAYATFTPFTAAQQSSAQAALGEWAANSGLVLEQVAPGKGDINFAAYNFSTDPNFSGAGGLGYNAWGNWDYATYPYFSGALAGSGNILMNLADTSGGQFNYETLLHETGHAFGFKHPDEAWTDYATNPPTVHNVWDPSVPLGPTVMYEGASTLTHLGALDIQAIQALYGLPTMKGGNDTSWSWNATTDTLTQNVSNAASVELRGVSTSNIIHLGSGTDLVFAYGAGKNTVYAGSGADTMVGGTGTNLFYAGSGADVFAQYAGLSGPTTVSFAKVKAGVTVDLLNPALNTGVAANDTFIGITSLIGSNHGDTLIGDNSGDTLKAGKLGSTLIGGTGNDTLTGGAGNDTLYGGGGADKLTGGGGANTFEFKQLSDSTVAASGRATITDFSDAQGDRIDLSALAVSLSESLVFIGANAFTGIAGQVREQTSGKNTLVQLDSTGSKTASFEIELKGHPSLSAADFIMTVPAALANAAAIAGGGGMMLSLRGGGMFLDIVHQTPHISH